jgi:hypothetical protein
MHSVVGVKWLITVVSPCTKLLECYYTSTHLDAFSLTIIIWGNFDMIHVVVLSSITEVVDTTFYTTVTARISNNICQHGNTKVSYF